MNRQRRAIGLSGSIIALSHSRSRTDYPWLGVWLRTCPNAVHLRLASVLRAVFGKITLLREPLSGAWRYGPFRHPRRACTRVAGSCERWRAGVYRGCTGYIQGYTPTRALYLASFRQFWLNLAVFCCFLLFSVERPEKQALFFSFR